jgi:hypothetical protein
MGLTCNQIESGRALGGGAKESEQLHIIPIIFVSIASKWHIPHLYVSLGRY